MSDVVVVVLVLAAMATARWLLADLRVPPRGTAAAPSSARVSVVVPARDEALTLPDLLASLAAFDAPVREVVVVDDASRDATAEVARSAGARVVPAGQPPAGWTGKAWACHVGADVTDGDLLLFLDADTVLATDALAGLLELHAGSGGLVSVQPYHRVVRPHEQLSAWFNVVAVMASAAFTGPRAKAVRSRVPMAFGPCLLTSRSDLATAGGHAAVRSAILDDAALAAAYLPVVCATGGASVRMRSYPEGLGQLAAGWTKNIASGASTAWLPAALGTGLFVSVHHAIAVGAMLTLLDATTGIGGTLVGGHAAVWVAAYVALAWQLRAVLRRLGSFRWWTWALTPVSLLAFDLLFARSAVLSSVRRSVTWRGRDVDLRAHDSAREVA